MISNKNLVAVVIPIYKTELTLIELAILEHNLAVLNSYPIVIVCPEDLSVFEIQVFRNCQKLDIKRFSNNYFTSIEGYNKLMLASEFYSYFSEFRYILICQTDAFVFKDELSLWCDKNYDYIGGPWLGSSNNRYLNKLNSLLADFNLIKRRDRWFLFKVGNGGFSLRKVSSFLKVLAHPDYNEMIDSIRGASEDHVFATEDLFWSFKAKVLVSDFCIPDYIEACGFSTDRRPNVALKIHKGLPFGCHGLGRPNVWTFWKPIIKKILKAESL